MSQPIIVSPNAAIPQNPKSHVLGWFLTWKDVLKGVALSNDSHDISTASTVYVCFGPNHSGSLNLFGGIDERFVIFWKALLQNKDRVVFLDSLPASFAKGFLDRLASKSTHPSYKKELAIPLYEWTKSASKLLTMHGVAKQNRGIPICVGDSHSVAFSSPGAACLKHDGKTCFGASKTMFDGLVGDVPLRGRDVTISLGSIDIRHHLLRHGDVDFQIDALTSSLAAWAERLSREGASVSIAAPVPVEFEGRRIPKTGFFEGTPFYGSREDRLAATMTWIKMLTSKTRSVIAPPMDWYAMDGEEFAREHMELSSSVHIGPHRYRRFHHYYYEAI